MLELPNVSTPNLTTFSAILSNLVVKQCIPTAFTHKLCALSGHISTYMAHWVTCSSTTHGTGLCLSSTQHLAARSSVLAAGEPAPPFLYPFRIFWAQPNLAGQEHPEIRRKNRSIVQCETEKDKNLPGLLLTNTELLQNLLRINLLVSTPFFFSNWRRKYRKNMYFQLSVGHSESPHQPAWHRRRRRTTSRLVWMLQVCVGHSVLPTFRKLPVFLKRRAQNKTQTIRGKKKKTNQSHLQSYERSSKQDGTCCLADPQWGPGRVPSYLIQTHKQVNDDLREQHWIYTLEETPSRELLRNCLYVGTLHQHFKSWLVQSWDSPRFWASPQEHCCFHSYRDGSLQWELKYQAAPKSPMLLESPIVHLLRTKMTSCAQQVHMV